MTRCYQQVTVLFGEANDSPPFEFVMSTLLEIIYLSAFTSGEGKPFSMNLLFVWCLMFDW